MRDRSGDRPGLSVASGRFCWLDLATSDLEGSVRFHSGLFGWSAREEAVNGGLFLRWSHEGVDVGSAYRVDRESVRRGAASHWTPYVKVADLDEAAGRAQSLGGTLLVAPFAVGDIARIALIADPQGAQLGLWEAPRRG